MSISLKFQESQGEEEGASWGCGFWRRYLETSFPDACGPSLRPTRQLLEPLRRGSAWSGGREGPEPGTEAATWDADEEVGAAPGSWPLGSRAT